MLGNQLSCVLYKMVSIMSYVMYHTSWGMLKQIECTTPFYIGFLAAYFDNNHPAFHKTNSSGKTLDTRQKIFYGPLVTGINKIPIKIIIFLLL